MNDTYIDTLDKVRQFLDGTDEVELTISGKQQRYDFIKRSLIRFKYGYLGRQDKGLILQYMTRISGYSHIQVKRLAAGFVKNGRIRWRHTATRGFACRYTPKDPVTCYLFK